MWAVIDISTVATAGISSFPVAFLKNDVGLQDKIKDAITKFKFDRIVFDSNATGANMVTTIQDPNTNTQPSEELRENILPSYNSVSGPFIYLGMWVFKFQNYSTTENTSDVATLTLWFALRFVLLFFFTIWLLLLVIANIMRIGLLRIFIIWAPFLILMQIFKFKQWGTGVFDIFKLSNLIAIIFKPVIFVVGISLMLIVIVSMQNNAWTDREKNLNGVALWTNGTSVSKITVEWISNISVDQTDILWKDTLEQWQNFFSQLVMLLLTIFLMRRFVKLSLTIGGWTIGKTMEGLFKHAEDIAKSAPVLPFKWSRASFNSIEWFTEQQTTNLARGFGMDTKGNFDEAEQRFDQRISDMMWIKSSWGTKDANDLEQVITSRGDFMGESIKIAGNKNEWLSINNNSYRWPVFKKWLATEQWNNMLKKQIVWANRNGSFEKTFDKWWDDDQMKKNRKALHKLMWGDAAIFGTNRYDDKNKAISYEELTNNVYYKSTE